MVCLPVSSIYINNVRLIDDHFQFCFSQEPTDLIQGYGRQTRRAEITTSESYQLSFSQDGCSADFLLRHPDPNDRPIRAHGIGMIEVQQGAVISLTHFQGAFGVKNDALEYLLSCVQHATARFAYGWQKSCGTIMEGLGTHPCIELTNRISQYQRTPVIAPQWP